MAAIDQNGLQIGRPVASGYSVVFDDLGQVLQVRGSVVLPFGLPAGFYVTLINDAITTTISTPGALLRAPLLGSSMTLPFQWVTVMRLFGGSNDWSTGQL